MKSIHDNRSGSSFNAIEYHTKFVHTKTGTRHLHQRRPRALYAYLQHLATVSRRLARKFDDGYTTAAIETLGRTREALIASKEVQVIPAQLVPGA